MRKIYVGAGIIVAFASLGAVVATLALRQPVVKESGVTQVYSSKDVAEHATKDDCWTIIRSGVYDLTGYIKRHPGGHEMLRACGTDATVMFETRTDRNGQPIGSGTPHSEAAKEQLEKLRIGSIDGVN